MSAASPSPDPDSRNKPSEPREVEFEVLGPETGTSGGGSSGGSGGKVSASGAGNPDGFPHGVKAIVGLAVAAAADALGAAFPPAWLLIDAFTTVAFFLIWGLRWEIAVVLLPELVPGMNVFPSWTLLAIYLGKKGGGN
jgi:hypothetical protein